MPSSKIPAHQLTDSPLSLEMLEGNAARELKERLLEAQTVAAMLQLLNGYILQLVNKAEEFHTRSLSRAERAAHAANEVASCRSRELLADVQKKLYMSERTFQRLFKETVGLTPNLYRRVYQFNAAFQQLNRNQFTKLSDVAFQNGYADQSHYIRTFREFTGITPKRYLNWASGV